MGQLAMEIRKATQEDLPHISVIVEKHNATDARKYFRAFVPAVNGVIDQSDKQLVLVAILEGLIAGFICLHSQSSLVRESKEAEFELVVTPALKRRKVGTELLKSIINFIKSDTEINDLIAKIKNGNDASEHLCGNFCFTKGVTGEIGTEWKLEVVR